MDSGENAEYEDDVMQLPSYSRILRTFLDDENLHFSKQDWSQLNRQTREFYETQDIDLSESNSRKRICDLICQHFPKIDLKTFRTKFTKCVANHRLYMQRHAEYLEEQNDGGNEQGSSSVQGSDLAGNQNQAELNTGQHEGMNGATVSNANLLMSAPNFVASTEDLEEQNDDASEEDKFSSSVPGSHLARNENHAEYNTGQHEEMKWSTVYNASCLLMSTPKSVALTKKVLSWGISNIEGSAAVSPIDSTDNEWFDIESLSCVFLESKMNITNSVSCIETSTSDLADDHIQNDNPVIRRLIEEFVGPSEVNRSPFLSSINSGDDLINFDETLSQEASPEVSLDGMANLFHVKKIVHRIPPANFRNNFLMCRRLNICYLTLSDVSLDSEFRSLFEDTYHHRTIILNNHSFEELVALYPCLENPKLLEMEARMTYSKQSIVMMKANTKALIKAVEEFYFYMNSPNGLQMFFQNINPNGGFLQIFTDPVKFFADNPLSTDILPYVNILIESRHVSKVRLLTMNMTIETISIEDALFLQIMIYHIFDKNFPESRKKEFSILEAFVLGAKISGLSEYLNLYINELSAMLCEIPTM